MSLPVLHSQREEMERGMMGGGMTEGTRQKRGVGLHLPVPSDLLTWITRNELCVSVCVCILSGERPFQCTQCGASFTQKGNLLRHTKLHSGEKPFKCPFCNYACRRRDALSGHIRTHTVGKLYKCSYCGRSYKQQSTLEEHLERCHNYLKSLQNHQPALSTDPTTQGNIHTHLNVKSGDGGGVGVVVAVSVDLAGRETGEGHKNVPSGHSNIHSLTVSNGPSNACHDFKDKSDTESTAEEQACPVPIVTTIPTTVKGLGTPGLGSPPISREASIQVVDGEGRAVRSFRCEHCRMFFLDHVMFTIHMGCHGFRQPFQCNVCGHCSQDRYQFTSHIIRGEHQVG
uniref:IKAROS family zinc finger 4 n=1 Tax=Hucho hucho TaxID=62062 RepID=A0A4W5RMG1_9TELE